MTALTEHDLRAAVDAALDHKRGLAWPTADLESAVASTASDFLNGWKRWPCEDDNCPARPAYDVRLSELYSELVGELVTACEGLIRDRLVEAGMRFAAEYPDVPRRALTSPD